MQAHEVLRQAADVIRKGWAAGGHHAEDVLGRPVPLHGTAMGGTSRVTINPNATHFSAYGAIAKVLASREAAGVAAAPIWMMLEAVARAKSTARPGGRNYLHPVVQYNADPGRTADEVIELLLEVADKMDPTKTPAPAPEPQAPTEGLPDIGWGQ